MRYAPAGVMACLVLLGCGAEAVEATPSTMQDQSLGSQLAPSVDADEHLGELTGVELNGVISRRDGARNVGEAMVALRWVIEYSDWPTPERNTSRARLDEQEAGEFILQASEGPPVEALTATEASGRAGIAVAYIEAFVDGNSNGLLDCYGRSDCVDVVIGTSPNAMIVYSEEDWPADGAPLFGFSGAPGVRPSAGWSPVHFEHNGVVGRPSARAWTDADSVALVIVGDFRELDRDEARSVHLDVD